MKKYFLFLVFISFFCSLYSEVPANYRYLKSWKISSNFAFVDSLAVDTVPINFHNSNPIDKLSISNSFNGNLGSPIQSKIYFNRPAATDFIFTTAYFPYLMDIEHAVFYNTKTPFSNLDYKTGGTNYRDEDHLKFLFTANVNKKFNIGTTLDYIYARGEYSNQSAKRFAGSLFGSYNGERYSAHALLSTNKLDNFENGGVSDPAYITNPIGIKTKDIPTVLNGFSTLNFNQLFYNHQYSIGFERDVRVNEDSIAKEFVPVTRFAHTLKISDERKRYLEQVTDTKFYKQTYFPNIQTNDTSSLQTVTNNFSISLAEEFNKWMKFGLTAFVENEVQRYSFNTDTLLNNMLKSSTKVGGILSKQRGMRFRYNILGEINLLGYKAGDFLFDGKINGNFKLWNDSISLVARAFSRRDKPSYFLESYNSNHFRWQNDFKHVLKTNIGGVFSIPTQSLLLDVSVENINQYIYFDKNASPTQHSSGIQVVSANFKKDFHLGVFTLENNAVYQLSSNQEVLPLPTLTLYHNLYLFTKWFKVLSIQLGADVRYHTSYFAPNYMPAIGQFHNQTDVKIGNYPVMNAYLNVHLKRTRFYVEYYHVNQLFMKGAYFSMPNYPINPAILKLGISWNFYD